MGWVRNLAWPGRGYFKSRKNEGNNAIKREFRKLGGEERGRGRGRKKKWSPFSLLPIMLS